MNIQNEFQLHYKSQTQREVEEKCLKSQIIIMEGVVVLSLVKHLTQTEWGTD